MYAFNEGDRVRYVGGSKAWAGLKGTVIERFRDFDGSRILVRFDGRTEAISFDDDAFEMIKETYTIKNESEDYAIATMELTDSEAALIEKLVAELDRDVVSSIQPRLTIKKEKK